MKKQKGYYAPDLSGLLPLLVVLMVCAGFGVWKLIEVVAWLFNHVSIVY